MNKIAAFAIVLTLGASTANAGDDSAAEFVANVEMMGTIVGTLRGCGDQERAERFHNAAMEEMVKQLIMTDQDLLVQANSDYREAVESAEHDWPPETCREIGEMVDKGGF